VVLACAALAFATPADASYPGPDGTIAMSVWGNIFLIEPDGSNPRPLTDYPAFFAADGTSRGVAGDLSTSSDGTRVMYSRTPEPGTSQYGQGSDIFVGQLIGFEDRTAQPVTSLPGTEEGKFSPDATQIAFTHHPPTHRIESDIYLMNADGSNARLAIAGPAAEELIDFTPDGKWLVYFELTVVDGGVTWAIYRARLDGTDRRLIVSQHEGPRQYFDDASVSPDGEQVVYSDGRDLWLVDINGAKEPRRLTDDSSDPGADPQANSDRRPVFSPSGDWIVYGANAGYDPNSATMEADLWKIRPDGTDAQRVTYGRVPGAPGMPYELPDDWAPAPPDGITDCAALTTARRVIGTPEIEKLKGDAGDDLILPRGGADLVVASAGADCAFGERGADELKGGTGDDLLVGGPRRDLLSGGGGVDVLRCGAGRDAALIGPGDQPYGCERIERR
jgi:Tol biopolymer transport system component